MNSILGFLKPLASLKLTVVLLAMSIFLIFAGTLAQTQEGVWTIVDKYFRSLFVVIPLHLFCPTSIARVPGAIPFPGGLTLGVLLFFNLLGAHSTRFKVRWNRAGMIVTHLGVLALLLGEFITGAFAKEGNMTIDEGASASYVEDTRSCELVFIDTSDASTDRVVAVPQRFMERTGPGGVVEHPLLPCQIHVVQWMGNSTILGPMQSTPEQRAKATRGVGSQIAAVPAPRATGVDGSTIDVPAMYASFERGGTSLGTFMLTPNLMQTQSIELDGKSYGVELRFHRTYKPYSLHLIDFKHDKFIGTDTPRNFSSHLRLVDATRNVDREVLISMNQPLRYAGETFYQSAFKPGDTATILQVVRNPGWLIPYISCSMVTLGLLIHFGVRLSAGVRRRAAA